MVQIISEKANDYDDFFARVIDELHKQYKNTPKLLIFGVPDGDDNSDLHLSTYGMDSFDLFQVAAAIQHEATRDAVIEEQARLDCELDDEWDEEDEPEDI